MRKKSVAEKKKGPFPVALQSTPIIMVMGGKWGKNLKNGDSRMLAERAL